MHMVCFCKMCMHVSLPYMHMASETKLVSQFDFMEFFLKKIIVTLSGVLMENYK